MALNPVQIPQKREKSGGFAGKIAGTVVGGVAGAFAGNPIAGATIGGQIGGMIGNAAKPGSVTQSSGTPLSAMSEDNGVKFAQMVDAHKALLSSPDFTEPQKQELSQNVFLPTLEAMKRMRG